MPSLVYPDVSGRNATYEGLVLGMGPVGYWPLQETNGTLAEDLGSGNNDGTYTNTPTLGDAGPIARVAGGSRGVGLNGTTQHVLGPTIDITAYTAMATAIWFKATDTVTTQVIMDVRWSGTDGYRILLTANKLRCSPDDGDFFDIDVAFTDTTVWHQVVFTQDNNGGGGTTERMYLDGVEAGTGGGQFDFANANGLVDMGARNDGGLPFVGQLAHAMLFDYASTPAQIEALYLCGLNGQ
jgi:hypothetical protein